MKGTKSILILAVLLLMIFANFAFSQEKVEVTVKEAEVKSSASSFGKTVGRVLEGNKLEVLEEKGSWIKVKLSDGTEGWINKTAVAKKQSFSSSAGFVSKSTTATGATAKASLMGAEGGQFDIAVMYDYLAKQEMEPTAVDELEKAQKVEDPMAEYESFREEGKLGEFQEEAE